MAANSNPERLKLVRLERPTIGIAIKGTAPLISHAWDQKAREMMLAKQMGQKAPKELKDPHQDYEASMYRLEDGAYGYPAAAFKAAIVSSARYFDKVTMTSLRPTVYVHGEGAQQLVRLETPGPSMREDMVRVGMGTADIRYRAEYREWQAILHVTYLPTLLDQESIVALVDAAGMVGVGDWRPEKGGSYGTFEVIGE